MKQPKGGKGDDVAAICFIYIRSGCVAICELSA